MFKELQNFLDWGGPMPLGTLLFSCASTNFDQHLRATHKVAEHNSCVIKNHSALAPDSESAFLFGEWETKRMGDGEGAVLELPHAHLACTPWFLFHGCGAAFLCLSLSWPLEKAWLSSSRWCRLRTRWQNQRCGLY